jgi:hypothetical protein
MATLESSFTLCSEVVEHVINHVLFENKWSVFPITRIKYKLGLIITNLMRRALDLGLTLGSSHPSKLAYLRATSRTSQEP